MNEEFSESGFSMTPQSTTANQMKTLAKQQSPIETSNNQNTSTLNYPSKPSATSLGTQLSNGANEISDDEIGLIRRRSTGSSKKKSTVGTGILRTLFRFGSKKFKDKDKQSNKLSTPQNIKKELEEEVEKIRARKAALYEQEIIQEYYKRLIDQQKFQQIVNQQTQQRQQILNHNSTSVTGTSNHSSLNNTLKKQSIQQQIKKQQQDQQNLKNYYMMENANLQPFINVNAGNYMHQSNHLQNQQPILNSNPNSNQLILNKPMSNYDTNYLQTGYAIHNRPNIGLETNSIDNRRPKSSYLTNSGYENSILSNGYQNGGYFTNNYYTQTRKPFATNHLNAKQYPTYLKDKSIVSKK